jgi:cytochrome c-type biogenesis protein
VDAIAQAFSLGLLSAASPCLLPLYPGFIAYLAGNSARIRGRRAAGLLGVVVLAGVLATMLLVGVVLTLIAAPMSPLLGVLVPAADVLLIVLGLLLLAGRNPFQRLPGVRVPTLRSPYPQAFLYGMLLGPLALPCAGAFVVALLAISVGVVDAIPRVARFLVYGLGFGLPLVLLSLVTAARGQALVRVIVARHEAIERVAGGVLVLVGAWDLVTNWTTFASSVGR